MKTGWLLLLFASAPLAACWADPDIGAPAEKAASGSAPDLLRDAVAKARGEWDSGGFVRLAMLRKDSAGVAESLADLLDDPNPYVRVGACWSLGYTGRADLWPQLAAALKDEDWRVSLSACLGLARLKAGDALEPLVELKKSHWYPKVRDAANYAIMVLRGESPDDALKDRFEFSGSEDWHVICDFEIIQPSGARRFDPREVYPVSHDVRGTVIKRDRRLSWDTLDALKIGRKESPFDDTAPLEEQKKETPTFRSRYPAEYAAVSAVTGEAQSLGRILFCELTGRRGRDGETLLAFHGGRDFYGGMFVVSAEKAKLILNRDVESLLDWDGRLVALTSMGLGDGIVVEVFREMERWSVRPLHALPGSPIQSGIWPDGRLFVNCNGGAVIIGKGGEFEFLGSGKSLPEE